MDDNIVAREGEENLDLAIKQEKIAKYIKFTRVVVVTACNETSEPAEMTILVIYATKRCIRETKQ